MIDSAMQKAWERQEIRDMRKSEKQASQIQRNELIRFRELQANALLEVAFERAQARSKGTIDGNQYGFSGKVVGASRKQKNVHGHMGRVKGFKGVITLRAQLDPTLTANERGW